MYTSIMIWILQKLEGLSYGITTKRSCWHITISGRQPLLEKIYKIACPVIQYSNSTDVEVKQTPFPSWHEVYQIAKAFLPMQILLITNIHKTFLCKPFLYMFFFYLWLHYALPVTKSMSSWKTRHLTNCCKSPFYYKILGTFEANLEKCRFSYTGG